MFRDCSFYRLWRRAIRELEVICVHPHRCRSSRLVTIDKLDTDESVIDFSYDNDRALKFLRFLLIYMILLSLIHI